MSTRSEPVPALLGRQRERAALDSLLGDLPRPLQQILFDAADGITPSAPARIGGQEPAAVGL